MLLLIAVLQVVGIVLALLLFTRKSAAPVLDPRLSQLPDAFVSLQARMQSADELNRAALAELRREHAETAQRNQAAAVESARHLREEVHARIEALGSALAEGLNSFRHDNASGADRLREQVHTNLREIDTRLQAFIRDTATAHTTAQDVLHGKLNDLGAKNQQSHDALRESVQARLIELGAKNLQSHEALREGVQSKLAGLGEEQRQHQERLRDAVQQRLDKLNQDNAQKLDQMRATVDEKLQSTLNERLTSSFGQVTTHLGEVQKGLGEMREFANGVSDLKKVFTNVKARGIVGEFQLGQQLEQMFSREQYEKNVAVKPNSGERVEYALKVPRGGANGNGNGDTVLFPIDSKFPREDWERLEDAYEHGGSEEIAKAGAAFERSIRAEGKRICEKYINEPVTLPHAIMFLPTEGLYAEVMRRPGLQQDLQHQCNVTIAGPSTLMAILTSFRMGFHTIAMERKGHEIEKVLGAVKTEFGKFGDLIGKVETQVGTVQTTLGKIRSKTTTISRSLRGVTELPASEGNGALLAFEEFAGSVPQLAAGEDE
ncbi:DNA recombination protein RmuC [Terriglobus aquaticus]|uniref:DNA recombination protein RmuC n=1 Tax=Terriglobus aquaticus TaxID=940139 RepID=A0ABW9KRJ9_9BACT|nr:DNA recombination protein RmuC [Terriglobus aquaticus]